MINRKVREPYITDNPFRLVGAGAAMTQQQLRRKSEAASRSAIVGLSTSPSLETEFGSEDIEGLAASVRSLATATVRRTAYRILWPLSDHAIPCILDGQSPAENALAPEEFAQLTFLTAWYGFLRDKSPQRAAEALNSWIDLYNDTAMDSRLKALIMEDDNLDEDDAYERLLEAQEQIARHLLRRTASVAAQEWEAGNTTSATGIVGALLNSALDDSMQEEALDPVIEIGQGQAQKVEQLTSDLPPYTRGASTDPPRELVQLERLSCALANRHPMAGGWGDIVEHWYLVLGWKMRGAALELKKQGDDEGALTIVEDALSIVRDAELKERLLEDRSSLQTLVIIKRRRRGAPNRDRSDNHDTAYYCEKGQRLAAANRYDEALCQFDKAIEVDPANVTAWHYKGDILMYMGNYTDSMKCLEQAGYLAPDNEVIKSGIAKVRAQLEPQRHQSKVQPEMAAQPAAEMQPVTSAPALTTINGIGTTLYGSAPFPSDQRLRYSILYFVILYIPIFPIARYVVEPTGSNQWKFFGKTKWTKFMKVHFAVTCTLILVGFIAMMRASNSSVAFGNSYATSTSSAPTPLPAPGGSTRDNGSPASVEPANTASSVTATNDTPSVKTEDNRLALREQHRQHLEQQLKDWKIAIQSAKEEIASDDKAIDEERSALESLKAKIDGMNPDSQVQQEVDDYNALVQSYESQRRDFNVHVERHNSKLEASREAVRRHNAIVGELNKDR